MAQDDGVAHAREVAQQAMPERQDVGNKMPSCPRRHEVVPELEAHGIVERLVERRTSFEQRFPVEARRLLMALDCPRAFSLTHHAMCGS